MDHHLALSSMGSLLVAPALSSFGSFAPAAALSSTGSTGAPSTSRAVLPARAAAWVRNGLSALSKPAASVLLVPGLVLMWKREDPGCVVPPFSRIVRARPSSGTNERG